jgi:hypothetical protein
MIDRSSLCSIIIPVAKHHEAIAQTAIASAYAQTIPVAVIVIPDNEARGAGWARNHGVEQAQSAFVAFLDADDTLRSDYVERMIAHYERGKYVYCDDWQDESLHQTSDLGYYDGQWWHSVSCLIPTALFNAVGGFDETLPGLEDMDLFLKLQAHGVCGVRCPHPLLNYSKYGQRSRGFLQLENNRIIRTGILSKWSEGARMACNKCGGSVTVQQVSPQPGDILARALYTPRQMIGSESGRVYPKPRGFENYQLSVDPRDVAKHPELWERVEQFDPVAVAPDVDTVMMMAREAMENKNANI